VKCPENCSDDLDSIVYGRGPFHAKSSVCRAAVMSGIINDAVGGFMIVSYAET